MPRCDIYLYFPVLLNDVSALTLCFARCSPFNHRGSLEPACLKWVPAYDNMLHLRQCRSGIFSASSPRDLISTSSRDWWVASPLERTVGTDNNTTLASSWRQVSGTSGLRLYGRVGEYCTMSSGELHSCQCHQPCSTRQRPRPTK